MGLDKFGEVDEEKSDTNRSPTVETEGKPYNVWMSRNGTMAMFEFEAEYVRERISTELKDVAKERGILYWNDENKTIVFTAEVHRYQGLLDAMGLEFAIKENIKNLNELYDENMLEEPQGLDAFM